MSDRVLLLFFAANVSLTVAAQPEADAEKTIDDEIVVVGHQREYLNKSAESAVGLDLKLIETPAAVSVISQDILQDQQVNNVDDALRNVAGVTKFKTGNGGEEKFSIRGFDASQSIYKDGARINNALNASNIPSTETANIERIDVLKGPASLLYGQGEPAGVINYITKRPQLESYTSVEVLGGSDSFMKVEFDTTSAFGSSEKFAYRLVGAYEDSESHRDEIFRERLLLNPTFAFFPNEVSRVVLGYEYIDDEYTQDRGQVLDVDGDGNFFYSSRLNEDMFFGIPNWNADSSAESTRLYLNADYQFNDIWRLEFNYSNTENEKDNFDSSPRSGVGADGSVTIQPRKSIGEGEAEQWALKNFFDFTGGFGWQHKILVTYSFEEFSTQSTNFRGDRNVTFNVLTGAYSSDLATPVADSDERIQATSSVLFGLTNRGESINQDFEETGINVLDYITINDRWAWLIGGRHSDFEDNNDDFDDDNFSLRTGLVYTLSESLSFWGSYAEGYVNSGGFQDANGDTIDPEISEAIELGVKLALFDDQAFFSATLYDVQKKDIPFVIDPDAVVLAYDNIGEIESQGLELEIVGNISENWRIQGGYAYIDNEITEGGQGEFGSTFTEGNRLPGVAKNNINLFAFYETEYAGGEMGIGGGIFYQDGVYISTENNAEYDGWTQIDLAVYYKQDAWKAQVNIKNATDEDYRLAQALTTSDGFAAIRVGTSVPRSFVASLAYEF